MGETLNKPICVIPNGNVVFRKTTDCLKQVNASKKETTFANLDDIPVCICLSKEKTEIAVALMYLKQQMKRDIF